MTKALFFKRLRSMRVDSIRPMSDQLASRLHQCSFLQRNHIAAGVKLSAAKMRLIKSFEERLSDPYKVLITCGDLKIFDPCLFVISQFDNFLQKFFESFNEPWYGIVDSRHSSRSAEVYISESVKWQIKYGIY
jgi:hypothetical protein